MVKDWSIRLQHHTAHLTRAEQSLVDYVNRAPETAAHATLRDLAVAAQVSKPVVIRCFRRLGFDSFREFQDSIERFFATQIDSLIATRRVHDHATTIEELLREAVRADTMALERLITAVDPAVLREIAHRLHDARTVCVMGSSTGRYPAHYLAQRLSRYRITTTIVPQDPRHIPDTLHQLSREDCAIVFHYSDTNQELQAALHAIADHGTWSVLVSAMIHPDYVGLSDRFIHVPRGGMHFKNSMAVPMHFANLLLLSYEMLFREEVEQHLSSLETTRREWSTSTGDHRSLFRDDTYNG